MGKRGLFANNAQFVSVDLIGEKNQVILELNIKNIGNNIYTRGNDKRDESIVNFCWLSSDASRLPSYGIYISHVVRIAKCCTRVSYFRSINLRITQGYRYHKLFIQTFGIFCGSYSDVLSEFGSIYTVPRTYFTGITVILR